MSIRRNNHAITSENCSHLGETLSRKQKPRIRNRFKSSKLLSAVAMALPGAALAAPQSGKVIYGSATISAPDANGTLIEQLTDRSVINWESFSIGSSEYVRFLQPDTNSISLNQVIGGDPSSILGNLSANGQVYLVNPNGIYFGQGARVDVSGITASVLGIDNLDFINGNYIFSRDPDAALGSVINEGVINARNNGYVVLMGDYTENSGVIQADMGQVVLASGSQITMDVSGNNLISVAVDEASVQELAGVKNSGEIYADGGRVIMTTKVADGLIGSAVNNSGLIQAHSIVEDNGEIFLVGNGGSVVNSGIVDVSGNADNGLNGGVVIVKSDRDIDLTTGSRIIATGHHGGVVRTIASEQLNIEESAVIDASGVDSLGGFVEVSGHSGLNISGDVVAGSGGEVLIDPATLTIVNSAPGADQVGVSTIANALNGGTDVTLVASVNITAPTSGATITAIAGSGDLAIKSGTVSFILGSGTISNLPGFSCSAGGICGPGSSYDFNSNAIGVIQLNDLTVDINGGLTVAAGTGSLADASLGAIRTGGNVTVTAGNDINFNGAITGAGTALVASAGGNLDVNGDIWGGDAPLVADITLTAGNAANVSISTSGQIQIIGDLTLNATGVANVSVFSNGVLSVTGDLGINGGSEAKIDGMGVEGSILSVGGNLSLNANGAGLNDRVVMSSFGSSNIVVAGDINLSGDRFDLEDTTRIYAGGDINLNAAVGTLATPEAFELTLRADNDININNDIFLSSNSLTINADYNDVSATEFIGGDGIGDVNINGSTAQSITVSTLGLLNIVGENLNIKGADYGTGSVSAVSTSSFTPVIVQANNLTATIENQVIIQGGRVKVVDSNRESPGGRDVSVLVNAVNDVNITATDLIVRGDAITANGTSHSTFITADGDAALSAGNNIDIAVSGNLSLLAGAANATASIYSAGYSKAFSNADINAGNNVNITNVGGVMSLEAGMANVTMGSVVSGIGTALAEANARIAGTNIMVSNAGSLNIFRNSAIASINSFFGGTSYQATASANATLIASQNVGLTVAGDIVLSGGAGVSSNTAQATLTDPANDQLHYQIMANANTLIQGTNISINTTNGSLAISGGEASASIVSSSGAFGFTANLTVNATTGILASQNVTINLAGAGKELTIDGGTRASASIDAGGAASALVKTGATIKSTLDTSISIASGGAVLQGGLAVVKGANNFNGSVVNSSSATANAVIESGNNLTIIASTGLSVTGGMATATPATSTTGSGADTRIALASAEAAINVSGLGLFQISSGSISLTGGSEIETLAVGPNIVIANAGASLTGGSVDLLAGASISALNATINVAGAATFAGGITVNFDAASTMNFGGNLSITGSTGLVVSNSNYTNFAGSTLFLSGGTGLLDFGIDFGSSAGRVSQNIIMAGNSIRIARDIYLNTNSLTLTGVTGSGTIDVVNSVGKRNVTVSTLGTLSVTGNNLNVKNVFAGISGTTSASVNVDAASIGIVLAGDMAVEAGDFTAVGAGSPVSVDASVTASGNISITANNLNVLAGDIAVTASGGGNPNPVTAVATLNAGGSLSIGLAGDMQVDAGNAFANSGSGSAAMAVAKSDVLVAATGLLTINANSLSVTGGTAAVGGGGTYSSASANAMITGSALDLAANRDITIASATINASGDADFSAGSFLTLNAASVVTVGGNLTIIGGAGLVVSNSNYTNFAGSTLFLSGGTGLLDFGIDFGSSAGRVSQNIIMAGNSIRIARDIYLNTNSLTLTGVTGSGTIDVVNSVGKRNVTVSTLGTLSVTGNNLNVKNVFAGISGTTSASVNVDAASIGIVLAGDMAVEAGDFTAVGAGSPVSVDASVTASGNISITANNLNVLAGDIAVTASGGGNPNPVTAVATLNAGGSLSIGLAGDMVVDAGNAFANSGSGSAAMAVAKSDVLVAATGLLTINATSLSVTGGTAAVGGGGTYSSASANATIESINPGGYAQVHIKTLVDINQGTDAIIRATGDAAHLFFESGNNVSLNGSLLAVAHGSGIGATTYGATPLAGPSPEIASIGEAYVRIHNVVGFVAVNNVSISATTNPSGDAELEIEGVGGSVILNGSHSIQVGDGQAADADLQIRQVGGDVIYSGTANILAGSQGTAASSDTEFLIEQIGGNVTLTGGGINVSGGQSTVVGSGGNVLVGLDSIGGDLSINAPITIVAGINRGGAVDIDNIGGDLAVPSNVAIVNGSGSFNFTPATSACTSSCGGDLTVNQPLNISIGGTTGARSGSNAEINADYVFGNMTVNPGATITLTAGTGSNALAILDIGGGSTSVGTPGVRGNLTLDSDIVLNASAGNASDAWVNIDFVGGVVSIGGDMTLTAQDDARVYMDQVGGINISGDALLVGGAGSTASAEYNFTNVVGDVTIGGIKDFTIGDDGKAGINVHDVGGNLVLNGLSTLKAGDRILGTTGHEDAYIDIGRISGNVTVNGDTFLLAGNNAETSFKIHDVGGFISSLPANAYDSTSASYNFTNGGCIPPACGVTLVAGNITQGFNTSAGTGSLADADIFFDHNIGGVTVNGSIVSVSQSSLEISARNVTSTGTSFTTTSPADLTINGSITNNSNIQINGSQNLVVNGPLAMSGTSLLIAAGNDLDLGGSLGSSLSPLNANTILTAGNNVNLNNDIYLGTNSLTITADSDTSGTGDVNVSNVTINTLGALAVSAVNIAQTGGTITAGSGLNMTAGGDIDLTADSIVNDSNAIYNAGANLSITAGGDYNVNGNYTAVTLMAFAATNDLTLSSALGSSIGALTHDVTLTAGNDININNDIYLATNDLTITADSDASGTGDVNGSGVIISTLGTLTVSGFDINDTSASVSVADLNVTAANNISLVSNAVSVTNSASYTAFGNITQAGGTIVTGSGLTMNAGGSIGLSADSIANDSNASYTAATTLSITSGGNYTANGNYQAGTTLTLAAATNLTLDSVLGSSIAPLNHDVNLTAGSDVNLNNDIYLGSNNLTLNATADANVASVTIDTQGTLTISAVDYNDLGASVGVDDLILAATGNVSLTNTQLMVTNTANITAGNSLSQSGGFITAGILNMTAGSNLTRVVDSLSNDSNASYVAGGNVSITVNGNYVVNGAYSGTAVSLGASQDLTLAGALGTSGAVLTHDVSLTAGNNVNLNNDIYLGTNSLTITADSDTSGTGDVNVSAVTISTLGTLAVSAFNINDPSASISVADLTAVAVNDISLINTNVSVTNTASYSAGGDITQTGGTITAGSGLNMTAGGDIDLTADSIVNDSNAIYNAGANLSITAGGDYNVNGNYTAVTLMAFAATNDLTLSSALGSSIGALTHDVTLTAGNDININNDIYLATNDLTITADSDASGTGDVNGSGVIISTLGTLTVSGFDINDTSASVSVADLNVTAANNISLVSNAVSVTNSASYTAFGNITQAGGTIVTGSGLTMNAGGSIGLSADSIANDSNASYTAATTLSITSGGNYTANGNYQAGTTLTLAAATNLTLDSVLGSSIAPLNHDVNLTAGSDVNLNNDIYLGSNNLTLNATADANVASVTIDTQGTLTISAVDYNDLGASVGVDDLILAATGNVSLTNTQLMVTNTANITAGNSLSQSGGFITAGILNMTAGSNLTRVVDSLSNDSNASYVAGGNVSITVNGNYVVNGAYSGTAVSLGASQDLTLAGALGTSGAVLTHDVSLTAGNNVNLNNDIYLGTNSLTITADSDTSGTGDVNVSNVTINTLGALAVSAVNIAQTGGTITAGSGLNMTAGGDIDLTADSIVNDSNAIYNAGTGLSIAVSGNYTANGIYLAGTLLTLSATENLQLDSEIGSSAAVRNHDVILQADNDVNLNNDFFLATSNLTVTADNDSNGSGDINLAAVTISTQGGLVFNAVNVNDPNASIDVDVLNVTALEDILIIDTVVTVSNSANYNAGGNIVQTGGMLQAGGSLVMAAVGNITGNNGGMVAAAMNMTAGNNIDLTTNMLTIGSGSVSGVVGDTTILGVMGDAGIDVPANSSPNAKFEAAGILDMGDTTLTGSDSYLWYSADTLIIGSVSAPVDAKLLMQYSPFTNSHSVGVESIESLAAQTNYDNATHFQGIPATTIAIGSSQHIGDIVIGANGPVDIGGQNAIFITTEGRVNSTTNVVSSGVVASLSPEPSLFVIPVVEEIEIQEVEEEKLLEKKTEEEEDEDDEEEEEDKKQLVKNESDESGMCTAI
jgi:filamentous hemagglutinin family protein